MIFPFSSGWKFPPAPPAVTAVSRLLAGLFTAVLLAGCVTMPDEALFTEPSARFESTPSLYLRFSGGTLRDVAATMDDKEMALLGSALGPKTVQAKGGIPGMTASSRGNSAPMDRSLLDAFLERTWIFGAGLRGLGTAEPEMEAVLIGDFKPLTMRLALAADGDWEKTKDGGFVSTRYPVNLRPLQPGFIHISSRSGPAGSRLLPVEAYPARLSELASSDIFISANDPSIFFSGRMPLEASSLPVTAMVLSGQAREALTQGEQRYVLEVRLVMKDESTAKAFRPIARFLWSAAAASLFGDAIAPGASPLNLEKDIYVARDIELSAADLKRMFFRTWLAASN